MIHRLNPHSSAVLHAVAVTAAPRGPPKLQRPARPIHPSLLLCTTSLHLSSGQELPTLPFQAHGRLHFSPY
ncbi:hypothetical protein QC762_0034760 [Podospora pseudocomata]|uniref:Uncharacterized protein n=1 Tax=Podospora pseudocomata TaxID=2093779 RepID=A0ABR0GR05_9PEZI|nr:hypothetical protein QC762_0034760 [Podospora pseudocomata]